MIAFLSACAGMDQEPLYPMDPGFPSGNTATDPDQCRPQFGTYPRCYQRQTQSRAPRQSDPLTEASKQTRSFRTIIQNLMSIKRDISR
jgi:hypothetical protein